MKQDVFDFDVVVVGGSIAGSATALQLLHGMKKERSMKQARCCGTGQAVPLGDAEQNGCGCKTTSATSKSARAQNKNMSGDMGEGASRATPGDIPEAISGATSGATSEATSGGGDGAGRVLVIERQETLGRRVGESTVEMSTYFLTRVLGLTRYLNEKHTVKQGFRYWFTNESAKCMGCCSELGGRYLSRVGSFQVDRAELDAEVLRRVEAAGGEVWRPASVRKIVLEDGGTQTLTVKIGDEERTVTARWVVDASGRQAMIARQRDEVSPLEGHPTAAVWARWKNTLDFDAPETIEKFPGLGKNFYGTRNSATNHIMGDGWWAWVIPLKNGYTSVGVTWDQRLFNWPRDRGGTLGEQLRAVLETHPTGRELLKDAEFVEDDVHVRRNMPYTCKTAAGDGFLLVGDASGFVDPFYSMGLDYLSMTSISGVDLILAEQRGECIKAMLRKHNNTVSKTIPRWFEALFRDKYIYMGDYDLMRIAFLIDIGLYYFGIVMQPYKGGKSAIKDGMFVVAVSLPFYGLMRTVNRRLAAIGAERRRRGTFGKHNAGRRMLVPGFAFDSSILKAVTKGLWSLLKLEITEGWRSWRPRRASHGSLCLASLTPTVLPASSAQTPMAADPTPMCDLESQEQEAPGVSGKTSAGSACPPVASASAEPSG